MKIETHYVYPPIPDRRFDWCAHWDGAEPGDPVGYGKTEQEAIEEFREIVGLEAERQHVSGEPDKYAAHRRHRRHCALRNRGDFCTCFQADTEVKDGI